jgi:hypothetical protein
MPTESLFFDATPFETTNPTAGIFDDKGDWYFPSQELCKQKNISPNELAFNKARGTMALVVKRSARGTDFALSEAGLLYLETTLAKGMLKDGAPVREAYVVLAEGDLRNPHHQMKLVSCSSARETRQRVDGLRAPQPGKFGPFWWITAGTLLDEDSPF